MTHADNTTGRDPRECADCGRTDGGCDRSYTRDVPGLSAGDREQLRSDAQTACAIGPDDALALLDALDAAEAEVGRLRAWKSDAMTVLAGLQDLGDALGVGLGKRITAEESARAVRDLRAERDAARADLAALTDRVCAVVRAWEDEDPEEWDVHTTGVSAATAARHAVLCDLATVLDGGEVAETFRCDWSGCDGKHPLPDNYCSMQRRMGEVAG